MGLLRSIITRFQFRVEDGKLKRVTTATVLAERRMRRATAAAHRMSAAINGIGARVAAMAGIGGLGFVAAGAVPGIARVTAEYEKLMAMLEVATGSTQGATAAWGELQQFAASTPYQIDQVVSAFIKLKNLGLDASVDSLRSYGNTASSMGKSIMDMIEAVADAATGENERLKEFGIKASKQGAKTSYVFRGVTTTIQNDAKSIEGFLRSIGETQFAGAMDKQMKTLGGKWSNFKDTLFQVAVALGKAGLAELFGGLLDGALRVVGAIKAWSETEGNVARWLDRIKKGFLALGSAIGLLVAGKFLRWLGKLQIGFRTAGAAAMWANIKIMMIPAALGLILLSIEDLVGFTKGKDSIFGRMLASQGIDPEPFREKFRAVGAAFGRLWEAVEEGVFKIAQALGLNEASWTSLAVWAITQLVSLVGAIATWIPIAIDKILWFGERVGTVSAKVFLKLHDAWDRWAAHFNGEQGALGGTWTTTLEWMDDEWNKLIGETLLPAWGAFVKDMGRKAEQIAMLFGGAFGGLGGFLDEVFTDVFRGLIIIVESAINALAALLNTLPDVALEKIGALDFAHEGVSLVSDFDEARQRNKEHATWQRDVADKMAVGRQATMSEQFIATKKSEEQSAYEEWKRDKSGDKVAISRPVTPPAPGRTVLPSSAINTAAIFAEARGAAAPPSKTLNLGGVQLTLNVDGTLAMDSTEFAEKAGQAAYDALSGLISSTFEDAEAV